LKQKDTCWPEVKQKRLHLSKRQHSDRILTTQSKMLKDDWK